MLITIEGIDGAGKTTAANIVREYLAKRISVAALITSELNHTSLGQTVKDLLNKGVDRETELWLIMAARSHHINTVLLPELDSGAWVIMDRFIHSTLAYQAGGRMLDKTSIINEHMKLDRLPIPDLVIYLDVTPSTAKKRMAKRERVQGMDTLGEGFYDRARSMYLKTCKKYFSRSAVPISNESKNLPELKASIECALDKFIESHNFKRAINDVR